jgi:hypothetical protein
MVYTNLVLKMFEFFIKELHVSDAYTISIGISNILVKMYKYIKSNKWYAMVTKKFK